MRYNGLQLVIRLAVAKLARPELQRWQDALILGALREDVLYLAPRHKIWEHWSFSHFSGRYLPGGFIPFFTPSAATKAQRYFDVALGHWQQQQAAKAFVELGKASHLLIDMACPVHVHRVPHWSDGYEWYIEAHYERLLAQGLEISVPTHYATPRATVAGMAAFTRQFAPDRTHHHWGRWLKNRGWRQTHNQAEIAQQVAQIIPVAAGHLAAMYLQFLQAAKVGP